MLKVTVLMIVLANNHLGGMELLLVVLVVATVKIMNLPVLVKLHRSACLGGQVGTIAPFQMMFVQFNSIVLVKITPPLFLASLKLDAIAPVVMDGVVSIVLIAQMNMMLQRTATLVLMVTLELGPTVTKSVISTTTALITLFLSLATQILGALAIAATNGLVVNVKHAPNSQTPLMTASLVSLDLETTLSVLHSAPTKETVLGMRTVSLERTNLDVLASATINGQEVTVQPVLLVSTLNSTVVLACLATMDILNVLHFAQM